MPLYCGFFLRSQLFLYTILVCPRCTDEDGCSLEWERRSWGRKRFNFSMWITHTALLNTHHHFQQVISLAMSLGIQKYHSAHLSLLYTDQSKVKADAKDVEKS